MPLKEYRPGTTFPGVVGCTFDQAEHAWPELPRTRTGAPNVLFIILDDVGYAQLGRYGSPVNTPNIDALAATYQVPENEALWSITLYGSDGLKKNGSKPGLVEPLSDGPGKPVNIELHIGRKPILAAGNADGDLHMLWYSQTSPYKSLQLLLRHDDGEREYAYDAGAEKVQQAAAVHN